MPQPPNRTAEPSPGAAIEHGGGLDALAAAFPAAPRPWIDLSTGINPWPWPLPVVPSEAWTRLPDRSALAALLAAARQAYGAGEGAAIVAAPGSQALIQWLPRLLPTGDVAVCTPTYGEHARCWQLAGHRVRQVPSPFETDAAVVVLTRPNNPDGHIPPRAPLLALADRLSAGGGLLVVDEAFAEVMPEESLATEAGRPGLVVLRSFGKFFGLAGLRLGFALGPAELIARLADALGPWAVPGPGLAVATAALADLPWQAATRRRLAAARSSLDRLLERNGLSLLGGTDLFRLAASPEAPALWRRAAEAGIALRRFPEAPTWLRFGLPADGAAEARLARVLAGR